MQLPPLPAVRVFEVVARLGSVRQAAQELYVTPPAVSHQLAKLEAHLGATLFIRRGRTLDLTDTGRDFLVEVSPALQAIDRATSIASRRKERDTLTIAAPPTLTTKWLLPRLGDFFAEYPEYDVRLMDRMTLDPDESIIDVAIEYRFDSDPHFSTRHLMPDDMVALANPDYVADHEIDSLASLQGLTLIETERRLTSWKSVISDFDWAKDQRFLTVGYSLHAFDAAAQSLGVALGNRVNAEGMLSAGQLCIPFDIDEELLPPSPSYYVSVPPHKERWTSVVAFTRWLDAQ
jgi:DNA-binding transcriptional LysR family regulator